MAGLVAVMLVFFIWALVAGRLGKWSITAPLAMVVAGMVLTAGANPVFVIELETSSAETGIEVVLALLLFLDATEIPAKAFRQHKGLIVRLLFIGIPLSLGVAWLAGALLFPGASPWLLAVMATVVIPLDLAPAGPILRDRRIPATIRETLNVEGGLNDGLIAPIFLICLAGATSGAAGDEPVAVLVDALPTLIIAVLVGLAIGLLGARLLIVVFRAGWTESSSLRLGILAVPLLSFGTAILLSGNGFIAAFVTGICFGSATRRLPADALHFTEDAGTMLSLIVWFIFGSLVNVALGSGALWAAVPYALIALTVVRILPVMASLFGSGVSARDAFVLGWLGPRGMGSIVFGLLAYIGLSAPENDTVADVMVATVALSVVLHGLSAGPIGAWYGRSSGKKAIPEK
ncbi:MAG: cation:proton antiporter [Nakamurella sp.]